MYYQRGAWTGKDREPGSVSRYPHLPSSLVIAVRVKEEHLDMATPDKAPSPELPVPIENIKQETDD